MFNWTKNKVVQLPTSTKSKVKHIHPNLAWRSAAHCSQIQPNYACTTLSLLAVTRSRTSPILKNQRASKQTMPTAECNTRRGRLYPFPASPQEETRNTLHTTMRQLAKRTIARLQCAPREKTLPYTARRSGMPKGLSKQAIKQTDQRQRPYRR